MNQEEKYQRARKRVRELRDFYTGLVLYIVVMAVLFFVDYSDRGTWWVYWPAMGWGIAVVLHAFRVFGPGAKWEERKIKELMDRDESVDT